MSKQVFLFIFLTSTLFSCATETVIFSSGRDGNSNIYSMNSKGKKLQRLTEKETEEWSPTLLNKEEITFLRQNKDTISRFKLNLKTRSETKISHPENCVLDDKNILYSPTSEFQVYQCDNDVFLADAGGKVIRNLTENQVGKSYKAAWYPNGKAVVFTNDFQGSSEIFSINIDGSNLQNLTNHPANDEMGEISPDGKKLLFSSDRAGEGNRDLYIQNLETGTLTNITNTPDWELIGRWSLDGKRIYFGSNKDGNWELYAYYLKNKRTKRLTFSEAFDGDPRVVR